MKPENFKDEKSTCTVTATCHDVQKKNVHATPMQKEPEGKKAGLDTMIDENGKRKKAFTPLHRIPTSSPARPLLWGTLLLHACRLGHGRSSGRKGDAAPAQGAHHGTKNRNSKLGLVIYGGEDAKQIVADRHRGGPP